MLLHMASSDIMSPESIMAHSQDMVQWVQRGYKSEDEPGTLDFLDKDDRVVLTLNLHKKHGLYYSWMDTYATDSNPIRIHTVINVNSTASVSARPPVSTPHLIEDVDDEDEDEDEANRNPALLVSWPKETANSHCNVISHVLGGRPCPRRTAMSWADSQLLF